MRGASDTAEDAIKSELALGTASPATVTALQALLGLVTPGISTPTTNGSRSIAKPITDRDVKAKTPKPKTAPLKPVCAEETKPLSGREKYALATSIVNTCLKLLTDSLKTATPVDGANATTPATKDPAVRPKKPLQPRSGNATAIRLPPKAENGNEKQRIDASTLSETRSDENIRALAECARLCFAFLRSIDTKALGLREMPRFQLESGMLALAERLVDHSLLDLAAKELNVVKRCLESIPELAKARAKTSDAEAKSKPLASLLQLDLPTGYLLEADAIPVGVNYYQCALRLFSTHRGSRELERLPGYLSLEDTNGYVAVVLRQAEASNDKVKASKQLDGLANTLLSMCPSVATSADGTAVDSASPEAILKLQAQALQIRSLATHTTTRKNEVLGPLLKCMAAFSRRHRGDLDLAVEALESSFNRVTLSMETVGQSFYSIHHLLYDQADIAGLRAKALHWAHTLLEDCEGLEVHHSRYIAAVVRKASAQAKINSTDLSTSIETVTSLLSARLIGGHADYEALVTSMSGLTQVLYRQQKESPYVQHFSAVAAGFAQRYSRSYPDNNIQELKFIIGSALRCSKNSDEVLSWITIDAAAIFIQAGALKTVTLRAATRPLADAWSADAAAVSLGRILRALTLRSIRHGGEIKDILGIQDDELEPAERGALLEWQLHYVLELAPRTKYHAALIRLIPDMLQALSEVYSAAGYPVRRARVAFLVIALYECQASLSPPGVLLNWRDAVSVDAEHLGADVGLEGYREDIIARAKVAGLLADGLPTFDDLRPALHAWQQILHDTKSQNDLLARVDDPERLVLQLRSISAYLGMLGLDAAALVTLRMLASCLQLQDGEAIAAVGTTVELADQYLRLGYSESAGSVLARSESVMNRDQAVNLEQLQYQVTYAEYCHSIGNSTRCAKALENTRGLREQLSPASITREQRRLYELLHAQAWLVQSQHCLAIGAPHEALAAAKQSVKVLNSIWASLERQSNTANSSKAVVIDHSSDVSMDNLAKGVSKLDLTSKGLAGESKLPLICRSLRNLSDLYAHHGLFTEANHYSERAIAIATSVGATTLLSRLRSHRSRLLCLADQLEEAELCLAQDDASSEKDTSMVRVERLCALADLRAREGSWDKALELYDEADRGLQEVQSGCYVERLESCFGIICNGAEPGREPTTSAVQMQKAGIASAADISKDRQVASRTTRPADDNAKNATKRLKGESNPPEAIAPTNRRYYLIERLRDEVLDSRAIVALRHGEVTDMAPTTGHHLPASRVRYENLLRSAVARLESDVTLNVLTESTLSVPALVHLERARSPSSARPRKGPPQSKSAAKPARRVHQAESQMNCTEDGIADILDAARSCLSTQHLTNYYRSSTPQSHSDCSSLSKVTSLQSAISRTQCQPELQPFRQALYTDGPRIKSLQYEQKVVEIDHAKENSSDPLVWPEHTMGATSDAPTAQSFQEDYIDIIPPSWTVVSMCLSEDCKELYVARYRSKQTPIVVKLPFSRHKPDGEEDEAFDFHQGRSELREIVDLSNYTCHNPGKLDTKGAKSKWWSERESLDRRLHELLINMEDIWFGGFKGLFSQHAKQNDFLLRFRKAFDQILAKYLPSRNSNKSKTDRPALDDKILELFIGLGQDGTIDLDEPLADLLYFVVDMLQFSGERNAYDEIDFDSMTVDTLDALGVYHEANESKHDGSQHLVLVLDRRLQAFPWESMPCLQDASVSRVGSMLSLRQSLLAIRARHQSRQVSDSEIDVHGHHTIQRTSGTYILNPSSDLTATQTMLQPVLSTLTSGVSSSWTSMVNEAPSEDAFSSALSNSSMLLYFGHGAGSQYIRPRTIRRLERCSEVVWLMGCSSGAVLEYGELEPCAVPLSYLLAGGIDAHSKEAPSRCMAVVATLWDVTDKDIDRFSLVMGEEWGLWPTAEQHRLQAKTPKKKHIVAAPATPDQPPKTPKTPKVRKTPAPAKTPARSTSRPREGDGKKCSLVEAVSRSRESCYLRYLNGAAPVVYGIPVYLGD
ncbi:separin protein [Extremus antarcticus]|uniref:separase n=1 Tax=Extremus antarcticus TaxID=702011 RepID=A0AAJ0G5S6_9PEZI|nr:separin protein [Extremus antarcticus]